MPTPIKRFPDMSLLEFAQAPLDQWCVYLTRPRAARYAPTDVQNYGRLLQMGQRYTTQQLYKDYVAIYDQATSVISPDVLKFITYLAQENYKSDTLEMDILFTMLYAGMVAEEKKPYAVLKKRLKRLPVHKILIEHASIGDATTLFKRKSWDELDELCKDRGF